MMFCPAYTISGSKCRCRVKSYGVCGRHLEWAFEGPRVNDSEYSIVKNYVKCLFDLYKQQHEIEEQWVNEGHDEITLQSPWNGNLCRRLNDDETNQLPLTLQNYVRTSQLIIDTIEKGKTLMNKNLAYNLSLGVIEMTYNEDDESPYIKCCLLGARYYLN